MKPKARAALAALALSLAASLAFGQSTGPLTWPQATQAAYDAEMAATWKAVAPTIEDGIKKGVQAQVGTTHGQLTVDSLSVPSHDLTSPPGIVVSPIVTAGKYDGERIKVDLPRAGTSWSATVAGHLHYDVDVKVLFFHVKKTIGLDVTLEATKIHIAEELELDTKDPTLPVVRKTAPTKFDYKLSVKTGSTFVNIVLFFARPFLDKLIREQVDKALQQVDAKIAPIVGLPGPAWGTGAPAHGAFGQKPDLEKAALQISSDIQKWHMPYGTVLAVNFSDPNYGQGTPTSYGQHGDSAIWTGHYLAGESFRWAVTKSPDAKANADRVLAGMVDLFDAEKPGGGQLSRCVVPMSDPSAAQMLATNPTTFQTTLHGKPYVAYDHISRDQYLGVMHGLGCAYDFLDDPAQKKLAGSLITRAVDYLMANGWVALQHDQRSESAPFIQSPGKMVAFSALAAHVDPRFQAERDRLAPLVHVEWVTTFVSLMDPLNGYYGWNLGNGTRFHEMRLETDPARFMALERVHAMERKAIGHHENAYFQTVDSAVDPSLAAKLGPEITDELRRFATRPRRYFVSDLKQDPTILQDDYTVPLSFQKGPSGNSPSIVPVKERIAKYPVPVEKRVANDFMWQRSPFQLEGNGSAHEQPPGIDLVLPYWMARFYKLVP